MPCQCATTEAVTGDPEVRSGGCGCGSGADAHAEGGCGCAAGDRDASAEHRSLERVVMELDKRVRALEATR